MKIKSLFSRLGPGLLFAAAAVGTSHLVQSTRAGADYGFGLLLIIFLIAMLKYPAIRFGQDYSVATNTTLIHSYVSVGWPVTLVYSLIVLISMSFVVAALTLVTSGLLNASLGMNIPGMTVPIGIILFTGLLLLLGKYRLLEKINKILIPLLALLIIVVTVMLTLKTNWSTVNWALPTLTAVTLMYVVQIAGWLLTPMEGAVLMSLWTLAKAEGKPIDAKVTRFDFNLGYWISLILAFCFVVIGASVLYGSDQALPTRGGGFAVRLITVFSDTLGSFGAGAWAFPAVAIITLTTMYTTLLTAIDGYARNAATLVNIIKPDVFKRSFEYCIVLVCGSAIAVLALFMKSFTTFIDLVGALTFILGPVYAILNHRAMFFSDEVPNEHRPGNLMKVWSLIGIVVMLAVAIVYVYLRWVR